MIPIPAIDLKDGKVVRLLQGNYKEETIYSDSAAEMAKRFELDGAKRLHVVDLDGALLGQTKNKKHVESICRSVKIPIEVGGGIRDLKSASDYLVMGARWVVFGTKACLDKGFLKEAVTEFGDKAILGLDARNGLLATDGWTKLTHLKALDFAKEAQALGAKSIIYTDISKDGAMSGPNFDELNKMAEAVSMEVIASGGISALKDLTTLMELKKKNIVGAIIGKAIYEKKIILSEAMKVCSQNA